MYREEAFFFFTLSIKCLCIINQTAAATDSLFESSSYANQLLYIMLFGASVEIRTLHLRLNSLKINN